MTGITGAIGVSLVGIFVGLLLGLGLAYSKPTTQAVVTLLGATLGGAPIAYLHTRDWWYLYPAGLILGIVASRPLGFWLDFGERGRTQRGVITHGTGQKVHSVNYARPFESRPNLMFQPDDPKIRRELLEERPEGFKVKVDTGALVIAKIRWRATGLRKKS